jgi:hypothetical protein
MSDKIKAQLSKLDAASLNLSAKIDSNVERMRVLVGKLVGIKPGDTVIWKGERYSVTKILSHLPPEKGLPILAGVKLLKNGKSVKSETTIKGAWKPEVAAAKAAAAPAKRRGRPPKVTIAAKTTRVSRRAALAAIAPEGTA